MNALAYLLLSPSSGAPERITLSKVKTTIGRSTRSDVCLPDAFASRLHAEIRHEVDGFWLHDLGSANGTRHNHEVVRQPVKLSSGSEIKIGETVLHFEEAAGKASDSRSLIDIGTDSLDPTKTVTFSLGPRGTAALGSELSTRGDLLAIISKVGIALLSASGLDETLDQIAKLVFDAVPAERCVIMMKDGSAPDGLSVAVARERGSDTALEHIRISGTVMEEVLTKRNAVLTADAQHDPKLASHTMSLLGIRSVLAVPLSIDGKNVLGLIYADSPTESVVFGEEHLSILTTLASVAAVKVENARLMEARLERERLERELALASEIQQRFQPSGPPSVPGYDFQGVSFSCYEIGGDYYDFIEKSDGRVLIALGDVSGKGTAAALLMSSLHAAVHAQVAANQPFGDIPARVNEYLTGNTPSNRFVTLFIAELNPTNGTIAFINAGHNPPLIARAGGGLDELGAGGLPLGLMVGSAYEEDRMTLEKGDALVIYSDGVTEAVDERGEEFGIDRLKAVVVDSLSETASGMRDRIESALSAFTGAAPANDDITIVIVKRQQ